MTTTETPKRKAEGEEGSKGKNLKRSSVAYLSMEFGVDERLQLYCGGLGILAGDMMKEAADQQESIFGVGIFWNQGYCLQKSSDSEVVSEFPSTDRAHMESVEGSEVNIQLGEREIPIHALRIKALPNLYFLEPTEEADQTLTARLYQGEDAQSRLMQEMILGVGGVRVLKQLGIHIDLYHFNEGHAVFAGLELMRMQSEEPEFSDLEFERAWTTVRRSCVFTTHTPVEAGNEKHALEDIMTCGAGRRFTKEQMERVGGGPFNMTIAGLRVSCRANAVSKLHGEVASRMWSKVDGRSSIISITNGVHQKSWQAEEIREADDDNLWEVHQKLKQRTLDMIEVRTGVKLNLEVLTVGFARRSATYKRHNLIFKAEGVKKALDEKQLQLIFSGKAHPHDDQGKAQLQELLGWRAKWPEQVVYLENYDMTLGRLLTSGCDVWLNNPVRPMEASGTSGMKAALNGVLNCSILDGWWPEGYAEGSTGWAVGEGEEERDDERDATYLGTVIVGKVMPTYSSRADWHQMMKNAIKHSSEHFCASRMLTDYRSKLYDPLESADVPLPTKVVEEDAKQQEETNFSPPSPICVEKSPEPTTEMNTEAEKQKKVEASTAENSPPV